jgi:hypothetical protein
VAFTVEQRNELSALGGDRSVLRRDEGHSAEQVAVLAR